MPEIADAHAVPITNISSCGARRFVPQRAPRKALEKLLGRTVGEVMAINVQFPNGFLDVGSPYNEFAALNNKLQAALSGDLLTSQTTRLSEAVQQLATLRAEGVLTDDEFERAKSGFLGADVKVVESSASLLRQLHSLYRSGVLTQSEFNMKKWDILSRPG